MGSSVDISGAKKKIAAIEAQLDAIDYSEIQFVALNQVIGIIKNRIFNRRRATDQTTLGKYKGKKRKLRKSTREKYGVSVRRATGYELRRAGKGLQFKNKDLFVTGGLSDSIIIVNKDNFARVTIIDQKKKSVATGQEEQIGKRIFKATPKEIKTYRAIIRKLLKESHANIR